MLRSRQHIVLPFHSSKKSFSCIALPTKPYASLAATAAPIAFAKTLSAGLIARGMRVNVVSPGPIGTPLHGKLGMSAEQ